MASFCWRASLALASDFNLIGVTRDPPFRPIAAKNSDTAGVICGIRIFDGYILWRYRVKFFSLMGQLALQFAHPLFISGTVDRGACSSEKCTRWMVWARVLALNTYAY